MTYNVMLYCKEGLEGVFEELKRVDVSLSELLRTGLRIFEKACYVVSGIIISDRLGLKINIRELTRRSIKRDVRGRPIRIHLKVSERFRVKLHLLYTKWFIKSIGNTLIYEASISDFSLVVLLIALYKRALGHLVSRPVIGVLISALKAFGINVVNALHNALTKFKMRCKVDLDRLKEVKDPPIDVICEFIYGLSGKCLKTVLKRLFTYA